MGLYGVLLLVQNYRLIRRGLTTNESLGYAKCAGGGVADTDMRSRIMAHARARRRRYDYLKGRSGKYYNPFDHGPRNNILVFLGCGAAG